MTQWIGNPRVWAVALVLTFAAVDSQPAHAYDDVTRERSEIGLMTRKFTRGVVNLLTGWIEIPKSIAEDYRKYDPFTGFVTGTIRGVVWGFGRTVTGAYEILTFPFPIPEDYEPIIEPEFVLPTIWGDHPPNFHVDQHWQE